MCANCDLAPAAHLAVPECESDELTFRVRANGMPTTISGAREGGRSPPQGTSQLDVEPPA